MAPPFCAALMAVPVKGLNFLHDVPKSNTEETVTKNTHLQDSRSMLTAGKIGMVLLACLFKKKYINPKLLPPKYCF